MAHSVFLFVYFLGEKKMFKKITQTFAIFAILVVTVMTVFPQAALAKSCKTYTEMNVTVSEWKCVQDFAASKGFPIPNDSGEVSKFTCSVKYNYDPSAEKVEFTPTSGIICPVSCSKIEDETSSLISEVTQKCKG
ncbi:MAG: hypothetical protein SAJ12_16025 [Jaaginema sp. PMC 1079.18]|nr:hypothetical protein [Jaaginema sp. PMC 1079.18]MEC4868656.1 hypothetical protein [Jaaginema sp. PMC 1078.18]